MDNPRLFLWIGLALLAWMNVVQWNRDYGAAPQATTAPATTAAAPDAAGSTSTLPELPSAPAPAPAAGTNQSATATAAAPAAPTGDATALATAPRVRVVTDVLDLDISLTGGTLTRADLLKYPVNKVKDSPPVRLLTTDDQNFLVVRRGPRVAGCPPAPPFRAPVTAAASEFRLAPMNSACRSAGRTGRASRSPRPSCSVAATTRSTSSTT